MTVKYIFIVCFVALACLGLAELLHTVKSFLLVGRKRAKTYSVLLLSGDNPERQLTFAAEQQLWLGKGYSDCVIAVNTGLSGEKDSLCREVAEKYNIVYGKIDEVYYNIKSFLNNTD